MAKTWAEMSREERLRHNISKGSGEWAAARGFNSIADVNAAFGDERPGRGTSLDNIIAAASEIPDLAAQNPAYVDQFGEDASRYSNPSLADYTPNYSNTAVASVVEQIRNSGQQLQQGNQIFNTGNPEVNAALYGNDIAVNLSQDGEGFEVPRNWQTNTGDLIVELAPSLVAGLVTGGGLFSAIGNIAQGGATLGNVASLVGSGLDLANQVDEFEDEQQNRPDVVLGPDYTPGREQPTFENVSAEEMDFEISRGPREGETLLDWLNRLQNLNEEDGGGSTSSGSVASGQMNPELGGMQGELPPEIGGRPPEGQQVDPNHEERDDVAWVHQNPDGTWVAGNNMGEVWEIDPPEGEEINDTPGVVIDDAQIADAGLVFGGLDPVLGGMVGDTSGGSGNNSGNGAGSGSGQGSNGPSPGSSGNDSNSSGSGNNGSTGGIGQMDPVLGGMQGGGTGTGSGSGDGAGEGGGSGGENPQSDDGGSETPITDSLFGSVAQSDSSELFPYTVIRPSRAAQLGGMMDYVAALNSRRRM